MLYFQNKEESDTGPSYGGIPYVTVVPSPGNSVILDA